MTANLGYTFFINYHSTVTEVFPLNFLDTTLVDELEKDQVFYRRKFSGELVFGPGRIEVTIESGKTVVSHICEDFTLFHDIEVADPYGRVDLLILKDLNVYYEAYFSTANGTWDLFNKTFSITPLPTDDYSDWAEDGDLEYNILDAVPEVTVNCNGYAYTHNRWLFDVIEYLADKLFDGCTVQSNFFTQTTDYVTLQPSKLLYLTIAQKSDIKNPVSSDPASIAMLSFNELMHILKMFNVFWTYNLALNILTVEHVSYFQHNAGLDLRTQEIAKGLLTYRRKTDDMPKYEKFSFMEADSADFTGGSIWYDSPVVDPARTDEYSNRVTTEIEMIQDDPDSVSNEGFVILANYAFGGSYRTYQAPGIIDTVIRMNMPLSWSYLLLAYHKHNRVLLEGYFNVTAQTFVSARKTITHEINAIVCQDSYYEPEEYITTELGETYFGGLKGYVDKAVIKPYKEINFTLVYGPEDNVNTGFAPSAKSLWIIQDGLDIWSELSEPNIYDTYYSILTNLLLGDQACDVVMIPAGTMYQHDMLSQINPIVTIAYNFTDSSLTGWSETVNGETSFLTCIDAECDTGSPAPPAIPAVPIITGHTQGSTCGPVRVNWTAEADATYYVIQRNPDLGGNANWETQYSGAGLYYDDYNAGTQEGVTFLYRVAAGNISGLSAWSAEHTVDDVMC